jgi:GxxExxY protein
MKHSELTGRIIECAYKVHNILGYGFLEIVYQNALLIELIKAGLKAEKEKAIQIFYENQIVGDYIADVRPLNSSLIKNHPIAISVGQTFEFLPKRIQLQYQ